MRQSLIVCQLQTLLVATSILFASQPAVALESQDRGAFDMEWAALVPATHTLSLDRLVERLRQTQAIGVFRKLALRDRFNELRHDIRNYEGRDGPGNDPALHRRFNRLVNEVLEDLRNGDNSLYSDIARSRHALWYAVIEESQKEGGF